MRPRIAIGDFSRMTHLSVKALRHYHDLGVLEPAEIDPYSGYRFYQPGQVQIAQVIRRFRDLGMPLDEIRSVLDAPDVATRNQVIVAHLERMEAQLAQTQSTVASLRSLLERAPAPVSVEYRSVPAATALAIIQSVSVAEFDDWVIGAFGELYRALRAAGVRPAGPSGALYPREFFEQERGDVVAFVPVSDPVPGLAGDGRGVITEIPAAELAIAVHQGSLGDLDQAYGALGTYVTAREIGVEGPIREYYLVSPLDTEDEASYLTEVCWPVFRTA
jgi:DNA-binding transcriptional MerR regulator/effector-binding domain-containing protein